MMRIICNQIESEYEIDCKGTPQLNEETILTINKTILTTSLAQCELRNNPEPNYHRQWASVPQQSK